MNFAFPSTTVKEALKIEKRNLKMSMKRFAGKVAIVTGSSKG